MDLKSDRIISKALFYDFPIDVVVKHLISEGVEKDGEWFYDKLKSILHNNPSFNMQEAEAIVNIYKDERVKKQHPTTITTPMAGAFKQLRYCAEQFLENEDGSLVVKEKRFLEWNDLTRMTGEDLLVCAWKGMSTENSIPTYAWPDVINCGGNVTKRISQKALCDIHAHLGGSANPFVLNWLCLMNGGFIDDRKFINDSKEYSSLRKHSVIAARIRVEMFKKFILHEDAFGSDFNSCMNEIDVERSFLDGRNRVKDLIDSYEDGEKQTIDCKYVDYAIREDCQDEKLDSPYMLWHGERRLICSFLSAYLTGSNEIKKIARYVYLYCLIKCHFRKEIMMTGRHKGFYYFNQYNKKRDLFISSELAGLSSKYAFQTSIRPNSEDGVEFRINALPKELGQAKDWSLNKCLFEDKDWIASDQNKNVTYVIHLSKSEYGKEASGKNEGMTIPKLLETELRRNNVFTGIDAAGGELICGPENLGHPYRYLYERGHRNFTYHVGEDFYDICDGLRAIDEAIVFLNVGKGWRLGHCVAMGIDATDFYKKNKTIVLPRQLLLDNLVWLICRCQEWHIRIDKRSKRLMTDRIEDLYQKCGYTTDFSLISYFNSIWLRSDVKGMISGSVNATAWDRAMECNHQKSKEARCDAYATKMAHEYRVGGTIQRKGKESETWTVDEAVIKMIRKLQNHLMTMVRQLRIGIESCPTSNMILCNIDRYEKVPLLRFSNMLPWKDKGLPVTINTDDKGLFSTSLLNEFSLIASALLEQKGRKNSALRENLVLNYLLRISARGSDSRFNWNTNEYETHRY